MSYIPEGNAKNTFTRPFTYLTQSTDLTVSSSNDEADGRKIEGTINLTTTPRREIQVFQQSIALLPRAFVPRTLKNPAHHRHSEASRGPTSS